MIDGFSYFWDYETKFIDSDFTRRLRSFGNQNASSANGLAGESIERVLESYFSSINADVDCITDTLPSKDDLIDALLDYEVPIILFGALNHPTTDANQPHAVLIYGNTEDGDLIVHYGHKNLYYVFLSYDWLGTYLQISDYDIYGMSFSDLSSSHWAYPGAAYCARYGIIDELSGTSFAPSAAMTRGMFMNALYHLAGEPDVSGLIDAVEAQFTDFSDTYIYKDALAWAYSEGIVVGTTTTTLSPYATVTREQAVTFLYRYDLNLCSSSDGRLYYDYDVSGPRANDFDDYDDLEDYAKAPMNWATRRYIIQGTDLGLLEPELTMPKEHCSTMIYNFSNSAVFCKEWYE